MSFSHFEQADPSKVASRRIAPGSQKGPLEPGGGPAPRGCPWALKGLTRLLRTNGASRKGACVHGLTLKPSSFSSSQSTSGGLGGCHHALIPCLPSCFCPDANPRASEPLRSLFPEMHSDSASKDLPGRILLDMDNDTESTAL